MAAGTGAAIRACAGLIRPDLSLGAGFFLVAGEIFAAGGMPPVAEAVLGFAALFFIAGSANISNDYFDRDVDRINLPERPLPSGRITVRGLWLLFSACTAAGLAAAAALSLPVLALLALVWGIALLYNMKLKEYGIYGNLVVASCVAMPVLLGGIIAGALNGVVLTFAALAFLFDFGEEIASDAMDVRGDGLRSGRSLAGTRGRAFALRISVLVFGLFFLLTLLPFSAGWFGYDYLLPVVVADLAMIRCTVKLAGSPTTGEGRVQIRRLYLIWGIFVIAFAVSRVFR